MSDDKIAEIRARYAGYSLNSGNAHKANEDRGWLLAEVDRLRAVIERLRENVDRLGKEVERADRLREEIARVKADNRSLVNRALMGKP
jgi:uncharacterized membrane protein